MNNIVVDVQQGTDEWRALRCGKATGSRMGDLTAKIKSGGFSASRMNYLAELVQERLTKQPADNRIVTKEMQWGIDNEPQARMMYELMHGVTVTLIGFAHHPWIEMSGASPDGAVGEKGLVQIKCPNSATHIETLLGGSIEGKYTKQMQWEMACTNRDWCDFVSYDPRMPGHLQMKVIRVPRDDAQIADLQNEVQRFLVEVSQKVDALNQMYPAPGSL